MPRTKPPDQRREDLLDAAESAFLDLGVRGATIDEITRRAGVAKGTFYLHFRSRADVVTAVRRRYSERFVGQVRSAVDAAGGDWGARLDAVVAAVVADHRDGRALHDALFIEHTPQLERDHDATEVDRVLSVLGDLLRDGVDAGAFVIDDPATTAMLLFNTLHGVYDPFWAGVAPVDDETLVAAAQQIFRRAVGLDARSGPAAG